MKKILIIIAATSLISWGLITILSIALTPIPVEAATYSIGGIVYHSSGLYSMQAEVGLFSSSTGGSPIETTCMQSNRHYEFDGLTNGTYYVQILCSHSDDGMFNWRTMSNREMVVISGHTVARDLTCNANMDEEDFDTDCPEYD